MSIETINNGRTRFAILTLLRGEYPSTLSTAALKIALDNLGYVLEERKLLQHVSYLTEKGYADMNESEVGGIEVTWVSLTAEGWDKLDGLAPGEGVDSEL
ncbi:MAG: hypothetical protein KAJ19_24105 [Gammaproteobacteria bacterium]|nr:hypothetical protein [Gammaproteobacteria bacterium]